MLHSVRITGIVRGFETADRASKYGGHPAALQGCERSVSQTDWLIQPGNAPTAVAPFNQGGPLSARSLVVTGSLAAIPCHPPLASRFAPLFPVFHSLAPPALSCSSEQSFVSSWSPSPLPFSPLASPAHHPSFSPFPPSSSSVVVDSVSSLSLPVIIVFG
ncbi:hypothetical protein VTK26DRAFT_8097 [Humicola hyalothermophila]